MRLSLWNMRVDHLDHLACNLHFRVYVLVEQTILEATEERLVSLKLLNASRGMTSDPSRHRDNKVSCTGIITTRMAVAV